MATDASSLVIPRFHDVLGDVMAHGHTHYWMPGGRGSTKSSFISVAVVLVLLANPDANAMVARRFSSTLRDSVFQQLTWAVAELGLERWFRSCVSPMELTFLPTGQRIVFRGADTLVRHSSYLDVAGERPGGWRRAGRWVGGSERGWVRAGRAGVTSSRARRRTRRRARPSSRAAWTAPRAPTGAGRPDRVRRRRRCPAGPRSRARGLGSRG